MDKLAQVRALENGKGIQHLLDGAYKIFNNPIAVFDTNYILKAHTNVTTDDPIWNELIETGTFNMKTQEFFAQECFTEEVANADKLVILKSNKLKYNRILGNILNKEKIKVLNLVMVEVDTRLGEEETAAFGELVDKFSNEIGDDEYYIAAGRAYYGSIIVKLLDGSIKDPLVYNAHVQIFYEDFEDYLYVAVVDISGDNPKIEGSVEDRLLYYKNLLEKRYRLFKYAVYCDYIVVVMSSKLMEFHEEMFFDRDDNPFDKYNLFMGISGGFENPYNLREYYDQAVTALKNGIAANSGKKFFLYGN